MYFLVTVIWQHLSMPGIGREKAKILLEIIKVIINIKETSKQ